jgi:hypothetical protein
LFEPSVERLLSKSPTAIRDSGLATAPPELPNLVREGGPLLVKLSEPIIVWVWAINVERGSLFRIRLLDPDRTPILDVETRALEGRKANYLAYVGGKHGTRAGIYDLRVEPLAGNRSNRRPNRLNYRDKIRRAIVGLAPEADASRRIRRISYKECSPFLRKGLHKVFAGRGITWTRRV